MARNVELEKTLQSKEEHIDLLENKVLDKEELIESLEEKLSEAGKNG